MNNNIAISIIVTMIILVGCEQVTKDVTTTNNPKETEKIVQVRTTTTIASPKGIEIFSDGKEVPLDEYKHVTTELITHKLEPYHEDYTIFSENGVGAAIVKDLKKKYRNLEVIGRYVSRSAPSHLRELEKEIHEKVFSLIKELNLDAASFNFSETKIYINSGTFSRKPSYDAIVEIKLYKCITPRKREKEIKLNPILTPLAQIEPPTLELKSELGFTLGLRISNEGLHFYGEKDKVEKHLEEFKAGMIALQAYTKSSGAFDFESMTNAQESMLKVAGFEDVFPYRGGLLDPEAQSILFE